MQQTTYLARSAKGKPVASFDGEYAAKCFVHDRAQRGVNLRLVRVTVKEEEL